jgi:hypothetical protein
VKTSIALDVKVYASTDKNSARLLVDQTIKQVLNEAFKTTGISDLRQGILTMVYNYETAAYEVRWDLAK